MAQRMLLSYTISVHLSMPATVHQERGRPCSTTVFFGNGFPSPRVILTPPLRCGIGENSARRKFEKRYSGQDSRPGLRARDSGQCFPGLDSLAKESRMRLPPQVPSPSWTVRAIPCSLLVSGGVTGAAF